MANPLDQITAGCDVEHPLYGHGVVLEYSKPFELVVRFDDDQVGDRRLHLQFAPVQISSDGTPIDFHSALPREEYEVTELSPREEALARFDQMATDQMAIASKAMGVATDEKPAQLAGLLLNNQDFRGRRLVGANFTGAYLRRANFAGVDLTGAIFIDADLESADFTGCQLSGADLSGAILIDAEFRGANLSGANLRGIGGSLVGFAEANLAGANLVDASLISADFTDANLEGASLLGAEVEDSDFGGANLAGMTLPDGTTGGH